MNKQDLQNNINQGENEQVEFKTSFSKEVIESLVAFSNTNFPISFPFRGKYPPAGGG